MARIRFGVVAGGLRAGISAGSCGLSPGLPALGLAAPVLHRRIARAAYLVRARQSERARSLAPLAHRLDDLPARHLPQLEAIRLSRSVAGNDEFHLARNTRHVSNLFATTTWIQPPTDLGLHRAFHGRSDMRRAGLRIFFRPPRTAARDGHGAAPGDFDDPFVGFRSQPAADFAWRIPDAIHGAGRVGSDPGPHQRALSRSIAGFFSGIGVPVRSVDCLRKRVFRGANGAVHALWHGYGALRRRGALSRSSGNLLRSGKTPRGVRQARLSEGVNGTALRGVAGARRV